MYITVCDITENVCLEIPFLSVRHNLNKTATVLFKFMRTGEMSHYNESVSFFKMLILIQMFTLKLS